MKMKALRCVIASLLLLTLPGLHAGCGADLDNPRVMQVEDTPEEQALYEEMQAEMNDLANEDQER